ncbi:hypothetical protein HDU67_002948 [Dinochytrium kinnereticum]|nr:hypothetical protein HDU67_002948 [Dinochytrium kinnereticum]
MSTAAFFKLPARASWTTLLIPSASLALLAAFNLDLFTPILWPFVWGLIASLPLHAAKSGILEAIETSVPPGASVAGWGVKVLVKFVFGPFHSVVWMALRTYHLAMSGLLSTPSTTPVRSTAEAAPVDVPVEIVPIKVDWALWSVQWAIRVSIASVLWNPVASYRWMVAAVTVMAGHAAYVVALRGGAVTTVTREKEGDDAAEKRDAREWNDSVSSGLIWSCITCVLGASFVFGSEVVTSLPTMTSQLANFISLPHEAQLKMTTRSTSPAVNVLDVIPDLGIRTALASHIPTLRSAVLSALDSKLNSTFPSHNLSSVEAASIVAAGVGVYETFLSEMAEDAASVEKGEEAHRHRAVEAFRSRFLLISDAVRHAAKGNFVGFLGAVGPAIGEIRAHGAMAFKMDEQTRRFHNHRHGASIDENIVPVEVLANVLPEDVDALDPTSELGGILGPKVLDLLFSGIVFFSTLGTFVASHGGLKGWCSALLGNETVKSLMDPLAMAVNLNVRILTFRVLLTYMINELVLGNLSLILFPSPLATGLGSLGNPLQPLAAASPFIAAVTTWAPVAPPIATLGLPLAYLLFAVVDGSPVRAIAVLVVHLWAAAVAEGQIILEGMGEDGIPALDGFAFWLGWFKFGSPLGIVVGPWGLISDIGENMPDLNQLFFQSFQDLRVFFSMAVIIYLAFEPIHKPLLTVESKCLEDDDDMYEDEDDFMEEDDEDEDEELDDDIDEDEDGFPPVIPDKDIKKPYDVDFIVHSIDDITAFQEKEIKHVAGILGCLDQHAATLLRHFKWNKERLIERYMDVPSEVCTAAGVILDASKQPKFIVIPGYTCEICYNDEDGLESLALSCGHRFCRDCYSRFLVQKIEEEGESRRIQCPGTGCKLIVDEKTVELVVPPRVHEKYRSLLLRTYVDDNASLKWCPAPNCEFAVECKVPSTALQEIVPTVKCRCGHKFCFGCGLLDHQPCVCHLVKLWLKKCEDDSETANWISANTKECEKCQSTIEKNGGCNHMTCRKCKHEFCWVCLGPWADHGTQWYNCNRFEERNSVDARDAQAKSRQALERYLHYYNRYANHEQSAKLDRDLYQKTELKMEEMQKSSELSWIEVQFLKKAVETLVQSRMTLKWTYCFAYYLTRNNATEIFESNQRDLEMAVEQLSELLEKPIEPDKISELKQQVLDKSVYVGSRREVLLTATAKDLAEVRWTWSIDNESILPKDMQAMGMGGGSSR